MEFIKAANLNALPSAPGRTYEQVTYKPDGSNWCAAVETVMPGDNKISEGEWLSMRAVNLAACYEDAPGDESAAIALRIAVEDAAGGVHGITAGVPSISEVVATIESPDNSATTVTEAVALLALQETPQVGIETGALVSEQLS